MGISASSTLPLEWVLVSTILRDIYGQVVVRLVIGGTISDLRSFIGSLQLRLCLPWVVLRTGFVYCIFVQIAGEIDQLGGYAYTKISP